MTNIIKTIKNLNQNDIMLFLSKNYNEYVLCFLKMIVNKHKFHDIIIGTSNAIQFDEEENFNFLNYYVNKIIAKSDMSVSDKVTITSWINGFEDVQVRDVLFKLFTGKYDINDTRFKMSCVHGVINLIEMNNNEQLNIIKLFPNYIEIDTIDEKIKYTANELFGVVNE